MRLSILITATLLMSASAQAEAPRGLSIAAESEPAATAQPRPAETPSAGTPKVAEQSSAGDAVASQPQADRAELDRSNAGQDKPAYAGPEKPRIRREPLEARVIRELHLHGIYW